MKYIIALLLLFFLLLPSLWSSPTTAPLRIDIPGFGLYETGVEFGIRFSDDDGVTWQNRNSDLPKKIVYPFENNTYREIHDVSVDPVDPNRIAVVTDSNLFVSSDGGINWTEIPTQSPISRVEVFTSVEVVPGDETTLYLGSSFNGLYISMDSGGSWVSLEEDLPELYLGAGFNEEIRALAVSPANRTVLVAAGFGGEVYQSDSVPRQNEEDDSDDIEMSFSPFLLPGSGAIIDMYYRTNSNGEQLVVVRSGSVHVLKNDSWIEVEAPALAADRESVAPDRSASEQTGIYVNSIHATGEKLEAHLDLLAEHDMQSIVVDVKDDSGYITYDSDLELHALVGAIRQRFVLSELLYAAHSRGVYVIGRIVVFQDPRLYQYDDGEYAAWNEADDEPWANLIPVRDKNGEIIRREQREYWVDPYSEFVWDYNIAIAKELEERGIDEVQFDYIRFPSDGNTRSITYRNARQGMTKSEALESFLKKASQSLEIPIGVDVFGFNGWYLMGNWIGQNIQAMAQWVDVISPMYYPSHYPRSFLGDLSYFERAQAIYQYGSLRAKELVDGKAHVRPYVQAFLIGGERSYEEPEYDTYLRKQLDGVINSDASGFTLWNASNNYYMIVDDIREYSENNTADTLD